MQVNDMFAELLILKGRTEALHDFIERDLYPSSKDIKSIMGWTEDENKELQVPEVFERTDATKAEPDVETKDASEVA